VCPFFVVSVQYFSWQISYFGKLAKRLYHDLGAVPLILLADFFRPLAQ